MNKRSLIFIVSISLLALSFSVFQYFKSFQAEFANATGPKPVNGHLWSEMECDSSGLCVNGTNVGIGTINPNKKLEVNGEILANGKISTTGTNDICNGAGACLSQLNSFIGSQPIAGGTNHSRTQCTTAGGTLVYQDGLANPICQFNNSAGVSCPTAATSNGTSVWYQYDYWSTTLNTTCDGSYWETDSWGRVNHTCTDRVGVTCSVSGHTWSNQAIATCVYNQYIDYPCNYFNQPTCYAKTTQIGCY